MTDEKRLFDKSPEELREAFVHNRFGQTDVFGLANIETWNQYQRTVERPDEVMWQSFLARDWMEMCVGTAPLTHLHERATRQHALRGEGDRYWRLLFNLPDGLYLGHQYVGIWAPGDTNEMFILDRDERGRLTVEYASNENPHVGARAVVDILFAEWNLQRPKWREARQFLCDTLAEEIKRERANAEADFNTAVAVSADGTKIVHADWVIVGEGKIRQELPSTIILPQRCHIFRGETFHGRKILRAEAAHRIEVPNTRTHSLHDPAHFGKAIVQYMGWAAAPGAQQIFCEFEGGGRRQTCLMTTAGFCPSPLPDGGVAVTV